MMHVEANNPALVVKTERRVRKECKLSLADKIVSELVSNWRETVVVSALIVDFYLMVNTFAFVTGVVKGWW